MEAEGETQSNSALLKQYHRAVLRSHPEDEQYFSIILLVLLSSSPTLMLVSHWIEEKDFSQVLTLSFMARPAARLKASCGGNSSSTPSVI